jgi:hypothetical protein
MAASERVRKLLLYKKYIDFCLEKELTGEYPRWGNQEPERDHGERASGLGGDREDTDAQATDAEANRQERSVSMRQWEEVQEVPSGGETIDSTEQAAKAKEKRDV